MSADGGGSFGRREVAYRLFAAEYDGADLEVSDAEEERAPNYVVTPTGARVNRLFVAGVLTEVEPVSDDVLRARVVDPTGAFVVYAGQYQPEAVAFLESADVPSFVSVTGKARTFQPEGSDRVFTSVRPESITAVDAPTRDRWTVQAAEHTLARIATTARAIEREERGDALVDVLRASGVDPGFATGIALAIDHYGTTPAYLAALREQAIAAAEVVAGTREAVPDFDVASDDAGAVEADLTAAPAVPGTLAAAVELAAPSVEVDAAESEPEPVSEPDGEPTASEPAASSTTAETEAPASADAEEPAADTLGDFEAPDVSTDEPVAEADDQYELDDAEREAVEEEFGTEFSPGSEVGEPGEADIEPESESAVEPSVEAEPEFSEADAPDETAADPDLEDAAVEAMAELDDGDGAGHDAVVDAVVEAHGADPSVVEDAIQSALMGGRCYEPADGRLKAI